MRLEVRPHPPRLLAVLAPLGAVALALLLAAIPLWLARADVLAAYRAILVGGLGSSFALTETLAVLVLVALFAVVALPVTLEVLRNHKRDGAARRVLADIRLAQSMAATRGGVHAWQWGPDAGRSERESRIVREAGECILPDPDAPQDGTEVVRTWFQATHGPA